MQYNHEDGKKNNEPSIEDQLKSFAEIIMDIYLSTENNESENAER